MDTEYAVPASSSSPEHYGHEEHKSPLRCTMDTQSMLMSASTPAVVPSTMGTKSMFCAALWTQSMLMPQLALQQ
jgi:hypothetical protein